MKVATRPRQATEKQVAFLRRLIRERDAYPGVEVDTALERLDAAVANDDLTTTEASKIIDRILTCPKRVRVDHQPLAEPASGMYRDGDAIYRVYLGQQSGRMLVKRIVAERVCEGHESLRGDLMGKEFFCDGTCVPVDKADYRYEYVGRADLHLPRTAIRMPLEEAKVWGRMTGTCCVCAKRLDVPESVDAGIGPKCARSFQ